ncbi:MAG: hypothetical protein WCJ35_24995 [Planctomycetota bacterium]
MQPKSANNVGREILKVDGYTMTSRARSDGQFAQRHGSGLRR